MPSTGTPIWNTACGAVGPFASVTDSGPPERMMPLRAEVTNFGVCDIPRQDLAVNAAFAHAASDQLSVLRTEVENQNAVRVDVGARQIIS